MDAWALLGVFCSSLGLRAGWRLEFLSLWGLGGGTRLLWVGEVQCVVVGHISMGMGLVESVSLWRASWPGLGPEALR